MNTPVPEMIGKQSVRVVSVGSMALGYLCRSRTWQVIAAFKRSFYCRDSRGDIVCIGLQEIGNGPFTLLCSADSSWSASRPAVSDLIRVRKQQLLLEGNGIIFDLHGASVWEKSLWSIGASGEHLLSDLRRVARAAVCDAPPGSLGCLVSTFFPLNIHRIRNQSSSLTESLYHHFTGVISEIRGYPLLLADGQVNPLVGAGLKRVMGLGIGLTPSGDDFLAGVVMGLFKTGRQDEAAWLARYFYKAAPGKVTDISLAFYRALDEGLVAESFYKLMEALGTGDAQRLKRLLKRVSRFGGTSGWDTIAGIVFGTSLALAAPDEQQDQATEAVC